MNDYRFESLQICIMCACVWIYLYNMYKYIFVHVSTRLQQRVTKTHKISYLLYSTTYSLVLRIPVCVCVGVCIVYILTKKKKKKGKKWKKNWRLVIREWNGISSQLLDKSLARLWLFLHVLYVHDNKTIRPSIYLLDNFNWLIPWVQKMLGKRGGNKTNKSTFKNKLRDFR